MDLIVPKCANFLKALQENPSSRWPSWLKGMRRARSEKPMYTSPQMPKAQDNLEFGLQYNGEDILLNFTIPTKFHHPAKYSVIESTR
jgi:hypothetical protein